MITFNNAFQSLRNSAIPLCNSAKLISGCIAEFRKVNAKFRKVSLLFDLLLMTITLNSLPLYQVNPPKDAFHNFFTTTMERKYPLLDLAA
jgi:hypothetical protein